MTNFSIEPLTPEHLRWHELLACVETEGQRRWLEFALEHHLSSHVLAAFKEGVVAGFLRFVVQPIGPADYCPPLMLDGEILTEAKILAFGVSGQFRRQGIGILLQIAAIDHARARGCYQVRSWSTLDHIANHHLKLRLGFSAHPEQRDNGQQGYYYLLPLRGIMAQH